MNIAVYIFGQFNIGYSQYPDDYTKSIFQTFSLNAKSATQIAIHRDGGLMYYGYIRKLEQGHYIGFCIVLNGLMVTKFDGLFSLYENVISTLVTNGQLIQFNQQGSIVVNVDRLYMKRDEIDFLTDTLRAGFYNLKNTFKQLPAVSYGISNDSFQSFSLEDNQADIIKASHTSGYTYIFKSKDFNTTQLNTYMGVLSRLNSEKIELAKQLDELKLKHGKTIQQKKQYRFVVILFFVLLVCLFGLLNLNDSLKNITYNLTSANKTINYQKDSINSQISHILNLENENHTLNVKYQETEFLRQKAAANLDTVNNIIAARQSFLIKNTSFNYSTGYLSFAYFGFKDESVNIQVRVYNDEGYSYSTSIDFDLLLGDNIAEVYINQDMDNRTMHSFEILIDDTIIGGDRL